MKKLLIALMLIAVVIVPMFAADVEVGLENKSDMTVTTHVDLVNKFGFTGNKVAETAEDLGQTLATQAVTKEAPSVTIYGSLITNSKEARTLTVKVTNLVKNNGTYVIPMEVTIVDTPVTLDGKQGTTEIEKVLLTEAATTSGKRAVSEGFTLRVTPEALNKAEVGDYTSTVTMTVTGK